MGENIKKRSVRSCRDQSLKSNLCQPQSKAPKWQRRLLGTFVADNEERSQNAGFYALVEGKLSSVPFIVRIWFVSLKMAVASSCVPWYVSLAARDPS